MNLIVAAAKYQEEPQRVAFYADLVQRVKAKPGVESAAVVNFLPLGGSNSSDVYLVEGEPEPAPGHENIGRYRVATPDYFTTMQIPDRQGTLHLRNRTKPVRHQVVIVNETLARKHWPGQEQSANAFAFMLHSDQSAVDGGCRRVKDVKHELTFPVTPEYYLPYAQDAGGR